ncbi:unnamed protein product [Linum tenue]|uniref:Uncharacterized protein n=1 Tax=Linum tenue TaxID=586396 RepID=A0AAV0RLT6_9ROSI|nr:unnamed protein product [Linum tenue]
MSTPAFYSGSGIIVGEVIPAVKNEISSPPSSSSALVINRRPCHGCSSSSLVEDFVAASPCIEAPSRHVQQRWPCHQSRGLGRLQIASQSPLLLGSAGISSSRVGEFMSKYTTGKVPKAFRKITTMHNWEDVLHLTEPEKWSPNGMYQATRIMASNLDAKKAERAVRCFSRLIFVPHSASCLQSGTCNLREAVIVGSVIQEVTIPALHSGYPIHFPETISSVTSLEE